MSNNALPESITHVCSDGETITIAVRQSARARRISFRLETGNFTIIVPRGTDANVFKSILPQAQAWIENHAEEARAYKAKEKALKTDDAPLPDHYDYTTQDGRTFPFTVEAIARSHFAKIKLENGCLKILVPKGMSKARFDIFLQEVNTWVDDNCDDIWARINQGQRPSASACQELPPARYDYTCENGKTVTIFVQRKPRIRATSLQLVQGQFVMIVPMSMNRYGFDMALAELHDWIEKYAESAACASPQQECPSLPPKPDIPNIPRSLSYTCRNGRSFRIKVQRSARAQRVRIKLVNNQFILVVPTYLQKEELDALLPNIYAWVEKKEPEIQDVIKKQALPEHVAIPLLAKNFRVVCEENYLKGAARFEAFDDTSLTATVTNLHEKVMALNIKDSIEIYGGQKNLWLRVMALQNWCLRMAECHLPSILKRVLKQKNFPDVGIAIRDQRSRWGSCTKKVGQRPTIALNWRAILLPEELLTHLCVHEVSHLQHMNHSSQFYDTMEEMETEALRYEKELDQAWKDLPWWATHKSQLNQHL